MNAPSFSPAGGVRSGLRFATSPSHERMHLLPQFRKIEEGRLPLGAYGRLLAALYAFHSTVAAALSSSPLASVSSSGRRLELLRLDLAAVAPGPLPSAPAWTPPSPRALLGTLYVAEGSMLGGRIIARQLDYLFGRGDEGRRFFLGSRRDGADWRAVLALLDRECTDEAALAEVIAGAEAGFDRFERCVELYA